MKAELNIPQELVDQIADRVLQKMLPILEAWQKEVVWVTRTGNRDL